MRESQTVEQRKTNTSHCTCHQNGNPAQVSCCNLVCFERPHYFCGHLLTDTDLSLEQRYLIEKNKLYHRTLDGYGVVCGLRMTCDRQCSGNILIGDGYAIDDCGNDLVVCEPMHFPVIAALRNKGYLIETPPDPCKKKPDEEECTIRQCFYITACYGEENADYTTPFKAGCGGTVSDCEPTRVREQVSFDVVEKLPQQKNPLEEIAERIRGCFRVLSEGPFAKGIRDCLEVARAAVDGGEIGSTEHDYYDCFCKIRVLFLHQLNKYPDLYRCTLEEEVRNLTCPKGASGQPSAGVRNAYEQLFKLIQQYVFDCVLGELVVPCPTSPHAGCVLLGTVEVEKGCITRVCNCPRWYVWSFANFFEVLLYELLEGTACARQKTRSASAERGGTEPSHPEEPCCPDFEIDLRKFLYLFEADRHSAQYAAESAVTAIRSVMTSLRTAFNFTDPEAIAMRVFSGMSPEQAEKLARELKLDFTSLERPPNFERLDPFTSLLSSILKRAGDPIVAYTVTEKKPPMVAIAIPRLNAPVCGEVQQAQHLQELKTEHDATRDELNQLKGTILELQEKIKRLEEKPSPQSPS